MVSNYSDIYLVPKHSTLHSRSDADISVEFLGVKWKAPWVPANMQTVIDVKIAKWLSENDYFYIMHRFGDNKEFIQNANKEFWKTISISVGVKEVDRELINWIIENKLVVNYITIDIAHGHSILMKEMISFIKDAYKKVELRTPKIIAGNVATPQGVAELAGWGADAVKVGIGGGGACSTKNQTGFHIPMFSCVSACSGKTMGHKSPVPIIADGGVKENGDIAKAINAGATMVMAGGMFTACIDSPAENVIEDQYMTVSHAGTNPAPFMQVKTGEKIVAKKYHGSASAKQKGHDKHVEGFEIEIPCNGLTYEEKYEEMTESLKSSVSYSGGNSLSSIFEVNFVSLK